MPSIAKLAVPFMVAVSGCGGLEGLLPSLPDAAAPPPDLAMPRDLTPPPDLAIPLRDPTAHPDPANVVLNGGYLLKHVEVVTVTWPGDALGPAREEFARWLVGSSYFGRLSEYGLSLGTSLGLRTISTAPPANLDDADVGPLLRDAIARGDLPAPDLDTLYVIYLPDGTTSTLQGQNGCDSYGGYHGTAQTGVKSPSLMAYAIIPMCPPGGNGQLDSDTEVVSHEVAEAVTDPAGTGYFDPMLPLAEIGDLCVPLDTVISADLGDGGTREYLVQRLFSAAAVKANQDPCVPAPGPPYAYFAAAMDPAQVTIIRDDNGNGSAMLQIEPFALGDNVNNINWRLDLFGRGISVSPNQGSGVPGSTQIVTITAGAKAQPGIRPMTLTSASGHYHNVWYGSLTIE